MKDNITFFAILLITNTILNPIFSQTQIGTAIEGENAFDHSGWSVSLSSDGNRLAVGAYLNDANGSNAGHVRIYEWNEGEWTQMGGDIEGEAAEDESGFIVSLSSDGSRVAIGAYQNDGNGVDAGHVRIYEWSDGAWAQMGNDIDGEAAEDWSGWSVSLSAEGNRVAIGAPRNAGNGENAGHVRIYEWNSGTWTQLGEDIDGEYFDYSGRRVSLSSDGNRVAIGAPRNNENGVNAGQVRIFEWDGGAWTQLGEDINGEAAEDEFGFSAVSLSSDGNRVAVGARKNDGNGAGAGHVRIYEWNDGAWIQLGNDIDGEAAGDRSGTRVSLSADGNRVAIGAPRNSGNGFDAGHVRLYDWNNESWVQVGDDIDGVAAEDRCSRGLAISADGKRVAAGAFWNDGNGVDAGHVRVFDLQSVSTSSEILVGEVMISPNPASSLLHIQLPDAMMGRVKLTIYDNRGGVLKQQYISAGQPIAVSELPNGFYTLKLTDGKRAYVGRFMKG
jgi:WD40 repeat protein